MIRRLIDRIERVIDDWHARNVDFFEYEPKDISDPLERYAAQLAYHNYQGWHYEAWMRKADMEQVAAATRKTFIYNRGRNEAIQHLDEAFFRLQKGSGECYSETPAMILDRLSILYLKIKYCEPHEEERRDALTRQFAFLLQCVEKLYDDLLSGKKQIVSFERTKHFTAAEEQHVESVRVDRR